MRDSEFQAQVNKEIAYLARPRLSDALDAIRNARNGTELMAAYSQAEHDFATDPEALKAIDAAEVHRAYALDPKSFYDGYCTETERDYG